MATIGVFQKFALAYLRGEVYARTVGERVEITRGMGRVYSVPKEYGGFVLGACVDAREARLAIEEVVTTDSLPKYI